MMTLRQSCRRMIGAGLLFLALAGCAHKREQVDELPVSDPGTAEQAAANLGNPLLANKGDINAVNLSVNSSEELERIDNGSGDELIWTNPDKPDEEIPGLTAVFENKRLGHGWLTDLGRAIQLARRQEAPLIVWFHDSVISPKSNALGKQYLETKEFEDWCRDRVVLVRLDSGVSSDDAALGKAKYGARQVNALQKRYGLTKKPAFAVITPTGKIVARIDGFDGFLSGFAQDLKQGVARAQKEHSDAKKRLQDRGYREWTSRRGNVHVFGKLMRFDRENGVVYLKESGGRVTRTKLESFCQADVDYLLSQPQGGRAEPQNDDPDE